MFGHSHFKRSDSYVPVFPEPQRFPRVVGIGADRRTAYQITTLDQSCWGLRYDGPPHV